MKPEVIEVLENSYTYPIACDPHGGRSVLGWAFLHIGKDVIEALLRLADSSSEMVRCQIDELLNGVLEDNESTGNLLPPILDCRVDKKHRALQLASW